MSILNPPIVVTPPQTSQQPGNSLTIFGPDGKILPQYLPAAAGKTEQSYPAFAQFPNPGTVNVIYYSQLAAEANKSWEWSPALNAYRLTSTTGIQVINDKQAEEVILDADDIKEKANGTNKYFTEARALGTKLVNYAKATTYKALAATDTVAAALAMLEYITEQKVNKNNSLLGGIPKTTNVVDTPEAPADDLQVVNVKFLKDRIANFQTKDKASAIKTFAAGTTTVNVTLNFTNDENRVRYAATRNVQLVLPATIIPDAVRTLYFKTGNSSVTVKMPVNTNTSTGPVLMETDTTVTIPANKTLTITLDPLDNTPTGVHIYYVLQP